MGPNRQRDERQDRPKRNVRRPARHAAGTQAEAMPTQPHSATVGLEKSMNEIAEIIRREYHLCHFGKDIDEKTGLIKQGNREYRIFVRQTHGFTNTAAAGALIPHLLSLYIKNIDHFSNKKKLHDELVELNKLKTSDPIAFERQLNIIQVVAMMRSTGRRHGVAGREGELVKNPDNDNGRFFKDQGVVECKAMLTRLGATERELEYANAIIECEEFPKENLSLAGCLLADAVMLENLRATENPMSKHKRPMCVSTFAVSTHSDQDPAVKQDFTELARRHANSIKVRNGYLYYGLHDGSGAEGETKDKQPLNGAFNGLIDNFTGHEAIKEAARKKRGKIEHNVTYAQLAKFIEVAQDGKEPDLALLAEPRYLKVLRHHIDHSTIPNDKKNILKALYRSLRMHMGQDKIVYDVVREWEAQNQLILNQAEPQQTWSQWATQTFFSVLPTLGAPETLPMSQLLPMYRQGGEFSSQSLKKVSADQILADIKATNNSNSENGNVANKAHAIHMAYTEVMTWLTANHERLQQEGILRMSGSNEVAIALCERFVSRREGENILNDQYEVDDVISGLKKLFKTHGDKLFHGGDFKLDSDISEVINALVESQDEINFNRARSLYDILRLAHLVSRHAEQNKMDVKNVAMVIYPSVLSHSSLSSDEQTGALIKDTTLKKSITSALTSNKLKLDEPFEVTFARQIEDRRQKLCR